MNLSQISRCSLRKLPHHPRIPAFAGMTERAAPTNLGQHQAGWVTGSDLMYPTKSAAVV